jgi:hypothetical protein
MSGAQKLCGEPECKAKARTQNLATRKRGRVDVKEEVARVLDGGRLGEANPHLSVVAPKRRNGNGGNGAEPALELDLTPLATYVQQLIARSQETADDGRSEDHLRELVREMVREELAERFKQLLGG